MELIKSRNVAKKEGDADGKTVFEKFEIYKRLIHIGMEVEYMKKRIISICLVIILVLSSSLVALAHENLKMTNREDVQILDLKMGESIDSSLINSEIKEVIDKDLVSLNKIGVLSLSEEFVAKVDTNNNIIYEGDFGGYTNTISIIRNDEDILKMIICQDDINNELIIRSDGTYILDGNVIGDEQTKVAEETIGLSDVEPKSVEVINRITNICPYGSASDYSYKLGTKKDANINLEKKISKIAVATFGTILCFELGVTTIVSKVYAGLYSFLKDSDPNIKGLSYKATNYAHKNYTNTYIKPIKMYGFKSVYKWYGGINYDGCTTTNTVYQTKEFS